MKQLEGDVSELATELGIKVNVIYIWRKECEEFGVRSVPGKGNLKLIPEPQNIHELEKN